MGSCKTLQNSRLPQNGWIQDTNNRQGLAMKGQAIEGSAGTELAEPFAGLVDQVLVKRVQDAFETGALDALLTKLGVGKLRIAGLDLNYCVLKTALAARNRGYEVSIVKEGTLSAASSERTEKQMAAQGVALNWKEADADVVNVRFVRSAARFPRSPASPDTRWKMPKPSSMRTIWGGTGDSANLRLRSWKSTHSERIL
jgi:glutamine phosphoribosylpyrophosphate amidotransferase